MDHFCHIEFRSSPLGRLAYVKGTRTPVWLMVDLLAQNKGCKKPRSFTSGR
jgi:hypothetical protein